MLHRRPACGAVMNLVLTLLTCAVWMIATASSQPDTSPSPRGAASYSPTTERAAARYRTTESTKTSEVIQRVVQAAIQSASGRRALRNRTRQPLEPAAASSTGSAARAAQRLATRPPDKPRNLYHSSYKNSSGVIHTLPTIRDDPQPGKGASVRGWSTAAPNTASGPPETSGDARPTKPARLRKYTRKILGNATTFSYGTTRATLAAGASTADVSFQQSSSPGETSLINNNIALKILKRPNTTSELKFAVTAPPTSISTARDPNLVFFEATTVNTTRNTKQVSAAVPKSYTASHLASSTHNVYTLTPFRAQEEKGRSLVWSPEYEQFRTADEQSKHTLTGSIALNDSHIKIAHISPKALSSIATASTTDRMKLFSVTIRTKNASPGNNGTTLKILEMGSVPKSTPANVPLVTDKYKQAGESALFQRSREAINPSTSIRTETVKITTARSIPVLSVKLNATRETNNELSQKQGQMSNNDGIVLALTSPTMPGDNILVGQGTTVEVSWKQSVTKSTTLPPKTNANQETTVIYEGQNSEDFFKLLHDMTSSTYKHNITSGIHDDFYKSVPRNNVTNNSGKAYNSIQRMKQDNAYMGQIQYSGISNSVVIPTVSERAVEKVTKPYTSKTAAVYINKLPPLNYQIQTSSRPVTTSTQKSVQQKSTARPFIATPSSTRAARRQVFMFRTPASANEIQKSSESETSEVTFSGSTRTVSRSTSKAANDIVKTLTIPNLRNSSTLRNLAPHVAQNSTASRPRSPPVVRGRRVTTLPPETTGRFFGWLASLQAPSTGRKTTRDAKETSSPEDKTQPSRLQRIFAAMQTVVDALMEVPRQIWLLPIRFGLYPFVNRVQEEVPAVVRFPCGVPPPAGGGVAPSSVHRLRPGDIRVVAALGDSVTAANGALANTEEDTRLNYRGVSAMAGGQAHWRKYLTLPNILKEFNPKLLGYSLGTADVASPLSGLNVAENGALDDQLLAQARTLVNRMRYDKFVDFDNDWKLVNILIGGNDICNEYCFVDGSKDSPSGHRQNLEVALDYLQRHLPRTFVNLIHIPNMVLLRNITNVPFMCYMKQLVLCSCLFGSGERAKAESVAAILRGYWDVERKVASLERYDTDHFAVVLQPFFIGVRAPSSIPTVFGQAPDLSYFAPDCFHFSQKGNSLVANALWNNMLEPVGNKTYGWQPLMTKFRCPSAQAPYLFTNRNSRVFLETGAQDQAAAGA